MSVAQLHQGRQGAKNGGTDTHLTPEWIIDLLPFVLGKEYLDPCVGPVSGRTGAIAEFDEQQDGLKQHWRLPAFVNPPFSAMPVWVEKAARSEFPVLLLAKFDPRVEWCRRLISAASRSRVIHGYTQFCSPEGKGASAMFQVGLYLINADDQMSREFDYRFGPRTYRITDH
jgi:hypothetical protein